MRLLRVLLPEHEKGWVPYPGEDDAALDAPGVLIFCRCAPLPCSDYRPNAAVEHVCTWKPLANDAHDLRAAEGI